MMSTTTKRQATTSKARTGRAAGDIPEIDTAHGESKQGSRNASSRPTKAQAIESARLAFETEKQRQGEPVSVSLATMASTGKQQPPTVDAGAKLATHAREEMAITGETIEAYSARQARRQAQRDTRADLAIQSVINASKPKAAKPAQQATADSFLADLGIEPMPVNASKAPQQPAEGPRKLTLGKAEPVDLEALMNGRAPKASRHEAQEAPSNPVKVSQGTQATQAASTGKQQAKAVPLTIEVKPVSKAKQEMDARKLAKAEDAGKVSTGKAWRIIDRHKDANMSDLCAVTIDGVEVELKDGQIWKRKDGLDARWIGYIKGTRVYFWDTNYKGFIPKVQDTDPDHQCWNVATLSEFQFWARMTDASITATAPDPKTPDEWKAYEEKRQGAIFKRTLAEYLKVNGLELAPVNLAPEQEPQQPTKASKGSSKRK